MTTRLTPGARALLALVPTLRRARGWRLYANDGHRFLDLWQDGGRGILGAKGDGLGRVAKAQIDLGLVVPFPSAWESRAAKALLEWKPGWKSVLFFESEERAVEAAHICLKGTGLALGVERPFGELLDRHRNGDGEAPHEPHEPHERGAIGAALAVLPCPAAWSPAVLLLSDVAAIAANQAGLLSDLLPPSSLATVCRSLSEFARYRKMVGEPQWRRADRRIGNLWERRGPWMIPRYPIGRHTGMFLACLERGLVISPEYGLPSILPPEFDDGELAPLSEIPGS